MEYNPKKHQRIATKRMLDQRHVGIFLDPGRGKTIAVLTAFERLHSGFDVHSMLVIAPLAVCLNVWPQEVAKWDHTQDFSVGIIHGKHKADVVREPHDIYVINPEGVPWLVNHPEWDWPDVLVVDESTKFKKVGSKRFKALRKVLGQFDRRYIMTGTPMPNGLLDLFGQVYVVDQGRTLGRSLTAYKQEYFVPVPRGNWNDWVPRKNADKQILEKISPVVLRLEVNDLDLPPVSTSQVRVVLPPKARGLYDKLRKDMALALEQGEVLAMNAAALSGKCRQVASGRIYLDDAPGAAPTKPDGFAGTRGFAFVHGAKEEALGRLVEELGGKRVIVAYDFNHDLAGIRKALGAVPVLKGGDPGMVTKWNRGMLPAMAVHPKSGGHGLNLQFGGHVLIWYSLNWDLELYQQMIKRLDRQGQENKVLVYQLVAADTVDETVVRCLEKKDADQRSLLAALKEDVA